MIRKSDDQYRIFVKINPTAPRIPMNADAADGLSLPATVSSRTGALFRRPPARGPTGRALSHGEHQPPSGACSTTAVCASTVKVPPPGTSSAGVASSGPVKTTTRQEAPNSFGGKVNSIGS